MKQKKPSEPFELTIEKLVYRGDGIGRHNGKVVFVPFSAPGDRLLVRAVEENKNFARAKIIQVLSMGPGRTEPLCPHFAKCGGCQWQHIEYPEQVEAKRKVLAETFHHRLPETKDIPIGMRACSHPFAYRSRTRIQLRGEGAEAIAGFFRCGSHSVEDVENCPQLIDDLNKALSSIRKKWRKSPTAFSEDEIEICSADDGAWASSNIELMDETILQKKAGEFTYSIQPSSFFQANDYIVPELLEFVLKCARDAGSRSAFDLFAGAGLFTLPLAKLFAQVIAVESSIQACRLCELNVNQAGFSNVRVECADVAGCLKSDEIAPYMSLDLILLDPPRAGAGPDVMGEIEKRAPRSIIYVSCDPQTLVRDLTLISQKYSILAVEGFDMFPQTYHFETIVWLKQR